jgi:hypothetical protein
VADAEGLGNLFDEVGTGAMLFLHLFNRTNLSAKTRELNEFLLDFLQPLLALAVSDLGLCLGSGLTAIPFVQFLKLHNLNTQSGNSFA